MRSLQSIQPCFANRRAQIVEAKEGQQQPSRSTTPVPSRPTTPRPPTNANGDQPPSFRSGLLTLRIYSGRNLSLPPGVPLPDVIQKGLAANAAQPQAGGQNPRESFQRKRSWWLPYVVMEFDKNEILVDALGGDIQNPSWMYKAHL